MRTSVNRWDLDEIDRKIFDDGLRITSVFFNLELDSMIILLNNKKVLVRSISSIEGLKSATKQQLENCVISRTGIHWPDLDEDLSLRGFLKEEMLEVLNN